MHKPLALAALTALVLGPAAAYAEDPVGAGSGGSEAPAATGRIEGHISLGRPAPERPKVPIPRDNKACGTVHDDQVYQVGGDGSLAHVVVEVLGIEAPEAPAPQEVEVDQHQCEFVPRVIAAPVGSTLVVVNSDTTMHNAHLRLGEKTVLNMAMPMKGMKSRRTLKKTGLIRFQCDAGHPWMRAWAKVTEHPWVAVTGADGRFVIENVPPGKHTLQLWHEAEGERTVTVEVKAGETATIETTVKTSPASGE